MATAYGKAHVYLGQNPPNFTMYNASGTDLSTGYIDPEMDEASLTVNYTQTEQVNTAGEIDAIRSKGEYLEAQFTLRPNSSTIADALKSATLPGAGFSFTVSGMKVIKAGSFSDAFNCTVSTSPWFVQPGASLRGPSQDAATLTVTARRYASITVNTPTSE